MERYSVDVQDSDPEFLKKFQQEIECLTGMIIEMFKENKLLLLSELYRKILLEKAEEVAAIHDTIRRHHIFVDNPGQPLEQKYKG